MRRLGSILSFLVSVACLALFVGAMNNVYGDGHELDELAARTACLDQGPRCNVERASWSRNAIVQTYGFVSENRTVVNVTCQRAFYVVGDYGCTSRSCGHGDMHCMDP
jgi:hypothetical protein